MPYSPPVANPCISRAITSSAAAQFPMESRVGITATRNEQADMMVTLIINAFLRPRRSANRPKNHEPTGRMTNVTAKIA